MTRPSPISVVVPALYEAPIIGSLLRHLRELPGGGEVEIVVVDGDPAGSTLDAVGDDSVVGVKAPRGRGTQMNAGADVACGEVLLFLHADCRLPDTALDDIRTLMADPGVAAGAFRLSFDNPRRMYRFMSWVVSIKTRLGRSPYGDQGIFLRKRYFDEIGGFAPVRIMEDVDLTRRIRRRGDRLVLCPSAVVTSSRRMESEGLIRRVTKNVWMSALFAMGVPPGRLERFYPSDPP